MTLSDPSESKKIIFFDEAPDTVDAIRFFGKNNADDDERFTVSRSPFNRVSLFRLFVRNGGFEGIHTDNKRSENRRQISNYGF